MRNDEEIAHIVEELLRLHLQEANLLTRLNELTAGENKKREKNDKTTGSIPHNVKREFTVGDVVKIVNPGPFQPTSGKITKIGKARITVQARNGSKISRAPKNLIFE